VARSTITSKWQTTVPKEVRERLGLTKNDVIDWEIDGTAARVVAASRAFLARRGAVRLGAGSAVDDVRAARRARGGVIA
jgi:AbrB family looped-hinge helix DNA binding protein